MQREGKNQDYCYVFLVNYEKLLFQLSFQSRKKIHSIGEQFTLKNIQIVWQFSVYNLHMSNEFIMIG